MEKASKQQICSKLCSNLATFLPIILVLVLFSSFTFFSFSKSPPFLLTIPIALLSTMFLFTLRKKKGSRDENQVQETLQKEGLQPSLDFTQTEFNQQSETAESHEQRAEAHSDSSLPSDGGRSNCSIMDKTIELSTEKHETAENHEQQAEAHSDSSFPSDGESSNGSIMDITFELSGHTHEQQVDSQSEASLPSDSESSTGSIMSENLELDHHGKQELGFSCCLASDNDDDDEEDSLIEIKLPSSHLPDFQPESIFKQQGLIDFLAEIDEMNEDENLIEIDISMGEGEPCLDCNFPTL